MAARRFSAQQGRRQQAGRAKFAYKPGYTYRHSLHSCRLINAIALERGVDTVVWQLIASVAAPGYTIHTIVALTRGLLEQGEVGWVGGGRGAARLRGCDCVPVGLCGQRGAGKAGWRAGCKEVQSCRLVVQWEP